MTTPGPVFGPPGVFSSPAECDARAPTRHHGRSDDQRRTTFTEDERVLIARDCATPLPDSLWTAFAQFNAGDYYRCHETIEQVWLSAPWPTRQCYKGLLHVAVGLYQVRRGRHPGAVAKLRSGLAYLTPFAPSCHGIDIAAVCDATRRCLEVVIALPPNRLDRFDWSLAPRLPERK